MKCLLLLQVIDLELPITVKLSVVEVDPGLKGDTAQGDDISLYITNSYLSTFYYRGCKRHLEYVEMD